MPIPIQSRLVPYGGLDFGLLDAEHLIGGWRSVKTEAERESIHASKRKAGMLVYVWGTKKTYELLESLDGWKEVVYGNTMTAADVQKAVKDSFFPEKLSPVAGNARAYTSTRKIEPANHVLFLGGTFQMPSVDYKLSNDGGRAVVTFEADVEDGMPVTVLGFTAAN